MKYKPDAADARRMKIAADSYGITREEFVRRAVERELELVTVFRPALKLDAGW